MKTTSLLLLSSFLFISMSHAAEYDCEKKYCKAMSSCDEAYYKLQICEDKGLDRDGDGVPCESVCGKGGKLQSQKSKQQIKKLLAEQEKSDNDEPQTKKDKE